MTWFSYPEFTYEEVALKWGHNYSRMGLKVEFVLPSSGWGIVNTSKGFWVVHFCHERNDPTNHDKGWCMHCNSIVDPRMNTIAFLRQIKSPRLKFF